LNKSPLSGKATIPIQRQDYLLIHRERSLDQLFAVHRIASSFSYF
jgi:hypothetical protein